MKDIAEWTREDYLYNAKLYYHIQRYAVAFENMREVIEKNPRLNKEERLFLSAVFKQQYQMLDKNLGVIKFFLLIEKKDNLLKLIYLKDELELIKAEMIKLITGFVFLINTTLLPQNTQAEDKVFYCKLKADYLRYKVALIEGDERNEVISETEKTYKSGIETSHSSLTPNNPLRLSIELNYAVFIKDIYAKQEESIAYLKTVLSNCRKDTITDKDSVDIYQLINDNIILWSCGES